MTKQEQFEIAKVMTGSKTQNVIIEAQLKSTNSETATKVAIEADKLFKENNLPFDKVFHKHKYKSELHRIAHDFQIDPATLFCIYMEWKNK